MCRLEANRVGGRPSLTPQLSSLLYLIFYVHCIKRTTAGLGCRGWINRAATVEEDVIREAPVVPTGGRAGRWQAITDTTTIESPLVDLKEKGATPQDRQFFVCRLYKENHSNLGCRGRNNRTRPPPAEPPRNFLRGTSRTGGERGRG